MRFLVSVVLVLFCVCYLLSFRIAYHHPLLNSITPPSFVFQRHDISSSYSSRHCFFQSQDYCSSCSSFSLTLDLFLALSPIDCWDSLWLLGPPYLPAMAGKHQYLILCSCTLHGGSAWAGSVCPTTACLCNCIPSYFHLLPYQEVLLFGVPTLDHGPAAFCSTGSIGTAVLNTVSEPSTTKPVLHLHLLSLSDFNTLSHAILWGEGV